MTENSKKVLDFLKKAGPGVEFTTADVQSALGLEKPGYVTGTITALCNKDRAERTKREVEYTDENGNTKTKTVSYFALTQLGMEYDPVAEEAAKAAEKEAKAAAKAAEKEAKAAAKAAKESI